MKLRTFVSLSLIAIAAMVASCRGDDQLAGSPCDPIKPLISVEQDGFFLIVEINRGAPPFRYNWSNGSQEPNLSDVPTGEYSVVVTDDNGCSAEASGFYEDPCDNSSMRVRVVGSVHGAAAIVTGGVPPYELLWSTGDTAAEITDLPEGEYGLTVTDSEFCKVQRTTIVGAGCGGVTTAVDGSGNVYQVVEIGGQCWLAENLRTAKYTSGDSLIYQPNPNGWGTPTAGLTVANDPDGVSPPRYGNHYNWHAVNDVRELCPSGWSVPDRLQWEVLMDYAGGPEAAGLELRALEEWNSIDPTAGDPHEFGLLPGGYLDVFTGFEGRTLEANFWTSEGRPQGNSAWNIRVSDESSQVETTFAAKNRGMAIRCIKD